MATLFRHKGRHASAERALLRHLLRDVSRSFYLSLVVLPRAVRQQVSLAYLFCRAADTIADTDLLARHERLCALQALRHQFIQDIPTSQDLEHLQKIPLPQRVTEGERRLLAHLPDCFRVYGYFAPLDRQLIGELVLTLTRGMEMDLRSFPGETVDTVRALPDMDALNLYTYYVAGVVGEFWTRMHAAHLPAMQHIDCQALCSLGISFGKGLQLTNILKDIGKDLHHGRCYLPEKRLEQVQVRVGDLGDPTVLTRLRPLIHALIVYTLDHLDRGCDYITRLPRRAMRLRLSCMWPLLFAVQTLMVIWQSEQLLQPHASVKIARRAVYRTMFNSLGCLFVPGLFVVYYRQLRSQLAATLQQID